MQGVFVVQEAVFGECVRGEPHGEVIVKQQEFAQGVSILGNGEAADEAVLHGGAQAGNFHGLGDPVHHLLALGGGGLGHAFGGHGSFAKPSADGLPDLEMAVFETGIELVHTDAGGVEIGVVAGYAVLGEKRFGDFVEGGRVEGSFTGHPGLGCQEARCQRNCDEG